MARTHFMWPNVQGSLQMCLSEGSGRRSLSQRSQSWWMCRITRVTARGPRSEAETEVGHFAGVTGQGKHTSPELERAKSRFFPRASREAQTCWHLDLRLQGSFHTSGFRILRWYIGEVLSLSACSPWLRQQQENDAASTDMDVELASCECGHRTLSAKGATLNSSIF